MRRIFTAFLALWAVGMISTDLGTAAATPSRPAAVPTFATPAVNNTLRALDKLRSYGYRWTTDAGALKVIKKWQAINGLVVDGIVGPQTLGSLDLNQSATVAAPAVRTTPNPAPQQQDSGSVESIIRDVWPDDLEDWAVSIAKRESNLTPHVRNSCCWGLFQINWSAHKAWLCADYGVCNPEQLYDARTNATVALALYQATGPGPWAL